MAQELPLLVWAQPRQEIGYWARLGVNVVVYGEKSRERAAQRAFLDAAKKHGVRGCLPLRDYSEELDRHPALFCWRHEDEPDLRPRLREDGYVPRTTPAELGARVAEAKGRKRPVWLNTTARFLPGYRKLGLEWYRRYYRQAELVGFDHYPVTGWNRPDRIPEIEDATRLCRELAPGKTVLPILEISDQNLAWTPKDTRGVRAPELRAQIGLALAGGAQGIGYFPCAFQPFRWHVLTKEIEVELARSNAELQRLAKFLVTEPGDALQLTSSSQDLRVGQRVHGDEALVIVVNRRPSKLRVQLRVRAGKRAPKRVFRWTRGTRSVLELSKEGELSLELPGLALRYFVAELE